MARSDLPNRIAAYRHAHRRLFYDRNRLRVGLLGGSFNPAHDGHLHISCLARQVLRLDQVWWLVSPQNPLKDRGDMARLAVRVAQARRLTAQMPWIKVIAPETGFRTNLTHVTLTLMRQRCPRQRFCWLMGADNLQGFSRWHHHDRIARVIPIAVFDRPGYSYNAICEGRRLLKRRQQPARFRARALAKDSNLASWCFIAGRRHHASATALRQAGKGPDRQSAFVESHN